MSVSQCSGGGFPCFPGVLASVGQPDVSWTLLDTEAAFRDPMEAPCLASSSTIFGANNPQAESMQHPLPALFDDLHCDSTQSMERLFDFTRSLLKRSGRGAIRALDSDELDDLIVDLVMELAADDFSRLLTLRDKWSGRYPFDAWILKRAAWRAVGLINARPHLPPADHVDPSHDPLTQAIERELVDFLRATLEEMNGLDDYRRFIVWDKVMGFKPRETAARLSVDDVDGKKVSNDQRYWWPQFLSELRRRKFAERFGRVEHGTGESGSDSP